jgi:hypothetical protein
MRDDLRIAAMGVAFMLIMLVWATVLGAGAAWLDAHIPGDVGSFVILIYLIACAGFGVVPLIWLSGRLLDWADR